MKSERTKEKIIQETIMLIKASNGDTESITIRKIAQNAGVGVGLINHYFKSKDYLIEVCVQTIIREVIYAFRPETGENTGPIERTKSVAKQVMDFLMDNKQVSRVSILGDMKEPQVMDNTMKTVLGFGMGMSGGQITNSHKINAFLITSVLQTAFLRRDLLKDNLDVDFNDKNQRDRFIDAVIERFG